MAYINGSGQTRVGVRSPQVAPVVTVSTLLTGIYSIWDGEASGSSLDTSILNAWNAGTQITVTTLNTSLVSAWNADAAVTTLNNSLVGAWNGNGNTNDSFGTNNGTAVGALTYATGKIGQGFSIDSTGNKYVTLPNNSLSQSGDFSISVWVNISGISTWSNWIYVLDNFGYETPGNNPYGYRLYINGNAYGFNIYNKTNTAVSLYYNAAGDSLGAQIAPPTGGSAQYTSATVKHIVITRKAGVGTKMYVNGYLKVSNTSSIDPVYFSTITPKIGAGGNTNTVIDGLTVWNKELSLDEITALYNSANGAEAPFTNSISVASSKDGVGLNHGTPQGGLTYTTGKVGNAFIFNGSNAYVELPTNSLNVSQTDLTINFWGSFSNDLNPRIILSNLQYDNSASVAWGWQIGYMNSQIYIQIANGLNSSQNSYAVSMPINQFTMFTFIVDSASVKIYKNGLLASSWAKAQTNFAYTTSHTPSIGARKTAYGGGAVQYFLTNIDKVDALTYWSKPLIEDEVTALYNLTNGLEAPYSSLVTYKNLLNDSVGTTNGTAYGTLSYTNPGKSGASYNFNGSSYIDLGNTALNFGTNSFSLSLWFNPTSGNVLQMMISKAFWGGSISGFYLNLENRYNSNQRAIAFGMNSGGYYSTNATTSGFSYTVGSWNHVSVTWDSSAKSLKIYLNGVLTTTSLVQGSAVSGIGNISNSSYAGLIGAYIDSNGSSKTLYYNGKMDSIATWNKVLSSTEVIQLYNNGVGGEYPFTSQLMASPNNKLGVDNGTLMNGTTLTTGKVGNAFLFDGVNDYVSLPNNSLSINGDFSISLWVYFNSLNQPNSQWNQQFIFSNNSSVGSYGFSLYKHSNNSLYFIISNSSSSSFFRAPQTLLQSTWYHVVITRKYGTTTKIYINGSEQTDAYYYSGDSSINPSYSTSQIVNLSGWNNAGGDLLNGKIDAFNVWQKTLTGAEVTELYNSGNGKQIEPTSIVTSGLVFNLDASRTSSYPNTGTTWTDISGNGNNGTLYNGAIFGTASGGQISFDGVNDYVTNGIITNLNLTNITISSWARVKGVGSGGYSPIVSRYFDTTNHNGWEIYMTSDRKWNFGGRENSSTYLHVKTDTIYSYNVWYNVTCVKSGSNWSIYINGVLEKTLSLGLGNVSFGSNTLNIGASKAPWWNDYGFSDISQVMIHNRALTATEITQNFNATKSRFGL